MKVLAVRESATSLVCLEQPKHHSTFFSARPCFDSCLLFQNTCFQVIRNCVCFQLCLTSHQFLKKYKRKRKLPIENNLLTFTSGMIIGKLCQNIVQRTHYMKRLIGKCVLCIKFRYNHHETFDMKSRDPGYAITISFNNVFRSFIILQIELTLMVNNK